MKANELMIGDWVYDTILCGNTKVIEITSNRIKGDIHEQSYPDSGFNPIPLTGEILKKNGFKQIGEKFIWGEIDDELIEITPSINNSYRIKVSVAELMTICSICCSYVHQLQHALWLCCVEKTVEL